MLDPIVTEVFLARRPSLLRRLARLLGCHAEAEDLAQEALIRAAQATAVGRPAAFLDRIATNLALDRRRGLALRLPASVAVLDGLACSQPDAERTLLDREQLQRTEAAIAAMPARRRAVFLAVRLDGLTHAEAARRFSITPAAVEKHIARSMLDLAAVREGPGSPF